MQPLLKQLLQGMSNEGPSVPPNDLYLPDWGLTHRKGDILSDFRRSGETQAGHTCMCTEPDCKWHFTNEPEFVTVSVFRLWISSTLSHYISHFPPPPEDGSEDRAKDARDTIMMYMEQWNCMTDDVLLKDPRYQAYRIGYDDRILSFAIASFSFRVPKI